MRYVLPLVLLASFTSPIASQPPTPALAAVSTVVETATIANVDGKWTKADVKTIAATVTVDGQAKWCQLRVRRLVTVTIDGQQIDVLSAAPVEVVEIAAESGRAFGVIAGNGRYQVEVICSDPQLGIAIEQSVIEIGDQPGPEPEPPGPSPNVPDDEFDNIGQRVASWSSGLPKRQQLGAIYADVAGKLEGGQLPTIDAASSELVKQRDALLTADELAKWRPFGVKLEEDFGKRWPMPRQTLVDYWRAVSRGLK